MTSESRGGSGGAPRQRESTVASRRVYEGRVLNLDIDRVRFPNGSTEGELELIRHSGAAAVVPFLDEPNDRNARVLLLRQYRYAADAFLYEIPAGRLNDGEAPIDCARRELQEEAGCTANGDSSRSAASSRRPDSSMNTSTLSSPPDSRVATRHRKATSSSISESHTSQDALRMIDRGEIVDAKTIISLFMADRLIRQ